MKIQLMQYLENKNIINHTQYGFRRKRNTFQALNAFSNDIFRSLDEKQSVLSVFIDFAKAFDTVNHKILLDKMHHYGIRGTILLWFKDYLTDRHQQVTIDGVKSSIKTPILGVPQGSVLGPILFLIYINYISNTVINSKTILFADDMTMYLIGPSPEQLITNANYDLSNLYQWCLSNRLTINTDKTYFMLFSGKCHKTLPQLVINRNIINQTNKLKFLGVTYDDSLTFKYHINNLTLKISRLIALLYQIREFMPLDVLKCFYYSHIYPLITYCNPIWCTTYTTYLTPLKLQLKKIVRIITNSGFYAHTDPLFKQLHFLKLEDITKLSIANFLFSNRIYIQNLLPTHDHRTRNRAFLPPLVHRLTKFRHSFTYLAPVVWNTIPLQIQEAPSLSIFKKNLKKYIINTY